MATREFHRNMISRGLVRCFCAAVSARDVDYHSIGGRNDPIDEVVPGLGMSEGQPGGGHGGDDEREAPEICRMNAAAGNPIVDRACEQEGEDYDGDAGGSEADRGRACNSGS